jgi:threonine dehydrogenase-like Zn-dependent dehydrogenase
MKGIDAEVTAESVRRPAASVTRAMRAAVFAGPGQIRIADVPLKDPAAGEVRIRMAGCGVCASNLGPWRGGPGIQYPQAPGAPGHEGWGVVEALGPGVQGLETGQPVAVLSYNAYAQYDTAPAAAVLPLPPEWAGLPFPGEPLACALNIFRRSDIEPGAYVVIIGIGFMGALLTALCSAHGARVIAVSRRPYALEVARRCGARLCMLSEDGAAVRGHLQELTGGRGCERVIEAVGMQWALDLASDVIAVRGRLVVAGYHQDGPRQINMQLWNWRGIDVINAHERDSRIYMRGLRDAVRAVQSGQVDLDSLLTHSFDLDQLPIAFDLLQQRPEGFLKAWIRL